MGLDPKTEMLVRLSAAVASNALVGIRETFTKALKSGVTVDDIQETITLALQIQQQPITHSEHLIHQLFRESKKKNTTQDLINHNHDHEKHDHNHDHVNSSGCGCGCRCNHHS